MKEAEKAKMFLNIGDQRISLTVPSDRQEFVRETEKEVDGLYRKWRLNFPAKSDKEIFAMVAYQYATFYGELKERYQRAGELAAECLRNLEPEQPANSPQKDDEELPD